MFLKGLKNLKAWWPSMAIRDRLLRLADTLKRRHRTRLELPPLRLLVMGQREPKMTRHECRAWQRLRDAGIVLRPIILDHAPDVADGPHELDSKPAVAGGGIDDV
jgi:hypothetical protein